MMRKLANLLLPARTSRKTAGAFAEHMLRGYFVLALPPFLVLFLISAVTSWDALASPAVLYYPPLLGAVWTSIFVLRKPPDDGHDAGPA
ncbi:MAG TPA: hypothetical protein VMH86_10205 [Rhizomicrobium sp.]|nr:hypothetical protein [Rhizomicrobium sp.]